MNSKLSKIDNLITEDLNTPLELEFQDNVILLDDMNLKLPSQDSNTRNINIDQGILEVKILMTIYGKI